MSISAAPLKVITQSSKVHSGTVIFLHGSGDTGNGVRGWIKMLLGKDMSFPQLRVIFPTAPERPYTPLGGELSNVWFDRTRITPDVPEHMKSLNSMANELTTLINKEVEAGIPINRIVIGGFSMGGAMAMHMGYRILPEVGGVFALSSFLNYNSAVFEFLNKCTSSEHAKLPPLFMRHGDSDTLVPHEWGEETYNTLKKFGMNSQFYTIKNVMHELHKGELLQLIEWINQLIPPVPAES